MYRTVVDTVRTVFSELRQTDNDWDFEDMEVFTGHQVKKKGSEYRVCTMFHYTMVMQRIYKLVTQLVINGYYYYGVLYGGRIVNWYNPVSHSSL